jgi:hypothetical protein
MIKGIIPFARRIFRATLIEERVAVVATLLFISINAALYRLPATERIFVRMVEYFAFGEPFYVFFFLFLCGLYAWKFCWRLARLAVGSILERQPLPPGSGRELMVLFVEPFRRFAPLVVVSASFYTLLGNISYSLRFSGKDELLAAIDRILFGTQPFIALGSAVQHPVLIEVLRHAYLSLSIIMSAALILLFSFPSRLRHYRQLVLAFIISLLIAFPLFAVMPCQDPYHTFIANIRGHEHAPKMQEALQGYAPAPRTAEITRTLAASEETPERDTAVPISCFPSMHATWSMLSIYFLFLLLPFSLLITVPWVILLLTGGLLFAQHYAVDYLVALPVAAASILISAWLLRREEHAKPPST